MPSLTYNPVSIFAPISIGNVSVGFDTLGLAIAPVDDSLVGDTVHIKAIQGEQTKSQFVLSGTHADKLPQDKNENIVWSCLSAFNQELEQLHIPQQTVHITLEKNIPVSSGLGSSACSVVAALVALNEFYHKPLDQLALLRLMGKMEGDISGSIHYDNVAPCFLGGLQLMLDDQNKIAQSLPTFNDVYWVIAYPKIKISTKEARDILPDSFDRKTTLQFGQNLAGFVDASYRQDKQQAFALLKDVIAEPYRKDLIPQFELAKKTLAELGALAVGISGSGPTLFCACDDLQVAENAKQWLQQNYLQPEGGFVFIGKVDIHGTRKID